MDKLKGIIFLLDSLFKSSKKSMFSNKILVDSKEAFELIDKLNQALSEFDCCNNPLIYFIKPRRLLFLNLECWMQRKKY